MLALQTRTTEARRWYPSTSHCVLAEGTVFLQLSPASQPTLLQPSYANLYSFKSTVSFHYFYSSSLVPSLHQALLSLIGALTVVVHIVLAYHWAMCHIQTLSTSLGGVDLGQSSSSSSTKCLRDVINNLFFLSWRKAAEKAEKPARKSKKDPKAAKRALSAYMFFSQDWRERIKTENPDAGFGELLPRFLIQCNRY